MNLLALSTWLLITALSSLAMALDVPTALTNYLSSYGFPINLEIFSDTPGNASTVQWLSEPNTLDAPHAFPINDTTYQWWWYDVISPNAESSIVLIFFTATSDGFALLPSTAGAVSLSIQALLPNGTTVLASIPASAAVVASGGLLGNGVAGSWVGTGAAFAGAPDNSEYVVTIDTAGINGLPFQVDGTLTFKSIAPPHYPCSTSLAAGQDLHVIPHLGWANALPGAQVTGSISVAGYTYDFNNALGYHDQNWGDYPFAALVQSWYWGHFTLGPYVVTVFDGIATDGLEHAIAYVAENDVELVSDCGVGSSTVRPINGTWPAHIGSPAATALSITIPLNNGQTLYANATYVAYDENDPGIYTRGLVNMTGYVGTTSYTGIGMFEQFRLS